MVFNKKSRGDLKTRFKTGRVDPMNGKTLKICWKIECQPFKSLFKEETQILQQEDDLQIRLLRPKANNITEVEKCDSKSVGLDIRLRLLLPLLLLLLLLLLTFFTFLHFRSEIDTHRLLHLRLTAIMWNDAFVDILDIHQTAVQAS